VSRPRVLVAVAAWLVVVAGVSALVWVVISRAGDELAAPQQPLVARTEQPTASPSTSPSPSPSPSLDPGQGEQRASWQGSAGLIIAACDGSGIRLVSAQPTDGFHAEIKDGGPDELEVEFEGREERSGSDVTVVAHCVSGVPTFRTQDEEEDD